MFCWECLLPSLCPVIHIYVRRGGGGQEGSPGQTGGKVFMTEANHWTHTFVVMRKPEVNAAFTCRRPFNPDATTRPGNDNRQTSLWTNWCQTEQQFTNHVLLNFVFSSRDPSDSSCDPSEGARPPDPSNKLYQPNHLMLHNSCTVAI